MPCRRYVKKNFRAKTLARICQANAIIDEYLAQGYKLTLRQIYYQMVSRDMIPNTQKSYKQLGEIISDGRLAGLIDWSAIEDRTRNVQANSHWDSPGDIVRACAQQFRFDTWEGQTSYVEVMVEKSALEGILEGICTDLDIAYMACRGYMSQSEMWNTAQRLIRKERQDCDTVILHLGDHDPSGLDMSRDIQDRLQLFGSNVDVRRIALNWDQIQTFNPPPNPARTTDARYEAYARQYGDESWELDSLEPRAIVDLIRENVEDLCDLDLRETMIQKQDDARQRLEKVADTL